MRLRAQPSLEFLLQSLLRDPETLREPALELVFFTIHNLH